MAHLRSAKRSCTHLAWCIYTLTVATCIFPTISSPAIITYWCSRVFSGADITFGTATRESMDLMTASPGVLYKLDGAFRNGSVKGKILPGFNLDSRKPLAENLKSTTSAIYSPKLRSKVATSGVTTLVFNIFVGPRLLRLL